MIDDSTVVAAHFDPGARTLEIATEKGRIRYDRVVALGATLGARMASPEWVEDNLPQTMLTELARELPKADAPRGMRWLHGDEELFQGAPVRDAISFTGGRWFRLFVGAVRGAIDAPPGA